MGIIATRRRQADARERAAYGQARRADNQANWLREVSQLGLSVPQQAGAPTNSAPETTMPANYRLFPDGKAQSEKPLRLLLQDFSTMQVPFVLIYPATNWQEGYARYLYQHPYLSVELPHRLAELFYEAVPAIPAPDDIHCKRAYDLLCGLSGSSRYSKSHPRNDRLEWRLERLYGFFNGSFETCTALRELIKITRRYYGDST